VLPIMLHEIHRMRILLIDDEPTARLHLRILLEQRGPIEEAPDALAGLQRIRDAIAEGPPFDLVCIDLSMPGPDGIEALKMMQEVDRTLRDGKHTNVVVVTASDDQLDIRAALHQHVDGYLLKPVTPGQILETIDPLD
jgi:two-component system chemotaxis response regulator CheY